MSAPAIKYGPKTIDDFDALPEDNTRRYELINGEIIVTSRPMPTHQRVMAKLLVALDRSLPPGYEAVTETAIGFDDRKQGCVPDLLVLRPGVTWNRSRFHSDDVALAVEIISGTVRLDRETKRSIYAAAGIPTYWMVLPDPFQIIVNRLVGHWYTVAEDVTGDELIMTEPFEAKIDLSAVRRAANGEA
ncbi:Uma2 family endonuclease [Cryptosporangium sp. NPDC048952]|uniref:Uma2 family endonuclease n=1 Tax=Cryptosporangium sp. NPDC048952 TaxID=3363961 RepID=UPI0037129FEA